MAFELNKRLLFDNIDYLVKTSGMGMGDFEMKAGVSPGFCSRSKKDEKSKPGIEFIASAACIFGVGIDSLLTTDFAAMTPTEQYYFKFLTKLEKDTREDKLAWNVESLHSLENVGLDYDGEVDHPLFTIVSTTNSNDPEYPKSNSGIQFLSRNYGTHTVISDDCYNLTLVKRTRLYLMSVSDNSDGHGKANEAVEVWMHSLRSGSQFICDDHSDVRMSTLVKVLYASVKENSRYPKIDKELRAAIDAFMADDAEDCFINIPEPLPE